MLIIPCPYLDGTVELTEERQQHILKGHPELLPYLPDWIVATVAEPDEVRRDARFPSTHLFARMSEDVGSKFVGEIEWKHT